LAFGIEFYVSFITVHKRLSLVCFYDEETCSVPNKQRLWFFVQVFPQLRQWCEYEERRLHLIDCDLRWV